MSAVYYSGYVNTAARNQVAAQFARAEGWATTALTNAQSYLNSLRNLNFQIPPISVSSWVSTKAPTLPTLPATPQLPTSQLPSITYQPPASVPAPLPPYVGTPVDVPDFTDTLQDFPPVNVPAISVGVVPPVAAITAPSIPSQPTLPSVSEPTFIDVTITPFSGIDTHPELHSDLTHIPVLSLLEPTAYNYTPPSSYTDAFLDALKSTLLARISSGGTGLNATVEQALWDRARARDQAQAANDEAEVLRLGEASGFALPAGATTFNVLQARQQYNAKASSMSRDIAIKQAELEQENIKMALQEGVKLEASVIDSATKLIQIGFESAKTAVMTGIEKYNADVRAYGMLMESYKAYREGFSELIKAELAKAESYKSEVARVAAIADANKSSAAVYESKVKAMLGTVEVYKAQVDAAKALMDMERTKVEASKAQIEGYIAGVNAQVAVLEGSKIQAQVQTAVTDAYKAKAQAYASRVEAISKAAQVDATYAQITLDAKKTEWAGYSAQLDAEKARIQALTAQSAAIVDGYKATASITVAQAEILTKQWEAEIKQYEAAQNYALQAAKANTDILLANRQAAEDAAKVGAQVYAQLVASAYGTAHASATVTDSDTFAVSNSYSTSYTSSDADQTNYNYNY